MPCWLMLLENVADTVFFHPLFCNIELVDNSPQPDNDFKSSSIDQSRYVLILIGKFISEEFSCQFYAN